MTEPSTTKDPRIEAGAKAWDKHMGGRYSPHEVDELSEEVAVILAAADAVGPRKPRTITTVEELDALTDGVTLRGGGLTYEHHDGLFNGVDGSTVDSELVSLPATVLHEPVAEATR